MVINEVTVPEVIDQKVLEDLAKQTAAPKRAIHSTQFLITSECCAQGQGRPGYRKHGRDT